MALIDVEQQNLREHWRTLLAEAARLSQDAEIGNASTRHAMLRDLTIALAAATAQLEAAANVSRETLEPLPSLIGAAPLVPPAGTEILTPADFAAWWNEQTDERRAEAYARIKAWSKDSIDCFVQNHVGRLENLSAIARDAYVSRETLRRLDAVDPLLLTLGQKVAVYRSPSSEGDTPEAIATFVHVEQLAPDDDRPLIVLDDMGERLTFAAEDHIFSIWKA